MSQKMANPTTPRVVIVGAGFAGLNAAQTLAKARVQITVIDRQNHHTFQPLLYQVATAGLSPGEIAAPIRNILRSHKNITVLMAEATGFDLERCVVKTSEADIPYDYLILAAAGHSYFGHDEWEPYAPGLKTIEDALEIRRRVLLAFELAERQAATGFAQTGFSKGETATPLNFVVVGGGSPIGLAKAAAACSAACRPPRSARVPPCRFRREWAGDGRDRPTARRNCPAPARSPARQNNALAPAP